MRNEKFNESNKGFKISNLKVTDKLLRVAATSAIAFCGTFALFASAGKHPFIVDKDIRYLTSPYPSRAFDDDYRYGRVISETEPWFRTDDSNYARIVNNYKCGYRPYKELEKIVKIANKEGSDILVREFGEPVADFDLLPYVPQSELEKGKSVSLYFSDEKGEFVVEDESFKDNFITTVAPVAMAGIAAYLASLTYDNKEEKHLKR